jgi:uncharacterized membrane protein YcgQ (UPF0703/DUF1980 family)
LPANKDKKQKSSSKKAMDFKNNDDVMTMTMLNNYVEKYQDQHDSTNNNKSKWEGAGE